MTPSKYQQAIYNHYITTNTDILVQAVAGSGKSTTITELAKLKPIDVLFLAFNKDIVTDLSMKVPPNVKVMTLHSLGMKSITQHFGNVNINKNKSIEFIFELNKREWNVPQQELVKSLHILTRLIDVYRLTMCQTKNDLIDVANSIGIESKFIHIDQAIDVIGDLRRYNKRPTSIDFTDMIYIPATNKDVTVRSNAEVVMIDECQDLSNAQHSLVERLTVDRRAIYVGDKNQTIYGFAGANIRSFERIKARPNIVELPLSVCYRCAKSIVRRAHNIFPNIEAAEHAVEGEVVKEGQYKEAQSGDMIICRNVNPLISVFFELLQKDVKCYIKGKDIGESLIKLITPYQHCSIDMLKLELRNELSRLAHELIGRGMDRFKNHPSYVNLFEKVQAIETISPKYNNVRSMIESLKSIFKDEGEGVILSSIHKSKGLESKTVFFLDPHLIPSKFATTEDQLVQETNLKYVAITRAKERLVYCYSE